MEISVKLKVYKNFPGKSAESRTRPYTWDALRFLDTGYFWLHTLDVFRDFQYTSPYENNQWFYYSKSLFTFFGRLIAIFVYLYNHSFTTNTRF